MLLLNTKVRKPLLHRISLHLCLRNSYIWFLESPIWNGKEKNFLQRIWGNTKKKMLEGWLYRTLLEVPGLNAMLLYLFYTDLPRLAHSPSSCFATLPWCTEQACQDAHQALTTHCFLSSLFPRWTLRRILIRKQGTGGTLAYRETSSSPGGPWWMSSVKSTLVLSNIFLYRPPSN